MTRLVAIDPGHGGRDSGAIAARSGKTFLEKDINLANACLLAGALMQYDILPVLTRSADEYVSLRKRAQTANRRKADLFVSVHVNDVAHSVAPDSISGFTAHYYPASQRGLAVSHCIVKHLNDLGIMPQFSNGIYPNDFYVLRKTRMPAVLIELGFIRNAADRQLITNFGNQIAIATSIAEAIDEAFADGLLA